MISLQTLPCMIIINDMNQRVIIMIYALIHHYLEAFIIMNRNKSDFYHFSMQSSHSVLMDFHLQHDRLVFNYKSRKGSDKTFSFRDRRFVSGKWHTVIVVVAGKVATITVNCMQQSTM